MWPCGYPCPGLLLREPTFKIYQVELTACVLSPTQGRLGRASSDLTRRTTLPALLVSRLRLVSCLVLMCLSPLRNRPLFPDPGKRSADLHVNEVAMLQISAATNA